MVKKWRVGATYKPGDLVRYNGKIYQCVQGHTVDAANWTPDATPALWGLKNDDHHDDCHHSSDDEEWNIGEHYAVGDIVKYHGKKYRCIQAHTVDAANWTPDATPALWSVV